MTDMPRVKPRHIRMIRRNIPSDRMLNTVDQVEQYRREPCMVLLRYYRVSEQEQSGREIAVDAIYDRGLELSHEPDW